MGLPAEDRGKEGSQVQVRDSTGGKQGTKWRRGRGHQRSTEKQGFEWAAQTQGPRSGSKTRE